MKLSVRPADLRKDRDALIELMLRYLTPMSDGARFDWLYHQNPDGEAKLWLLIDEMTQSIVGSGGIVPRRMYVEGREKLGAVLVDFWIHPNYRSLGPALQLQRACLAGIEAGPYEHYYDFPKQNMVAIYRRLGLTPNQSVVRMTRLLSVKRKLGAAGQIPLFGPAIIAGADLILNLRRAGNSVKGDWTISAAAEPCSEEFTELAREVSAGYGACVARTSAYLNWRFWSHFHHRFEMLTARRNGSLLGYLLFVQTGDTATIVDLFGVEDPTMKAALVSSAVETLRKRSCVFSVNSPCLGSHAHVALFKKLGFFPRESHPVVISATSRAPGGKTALEGQRIFLMDGDRDS